MQNKTIDVTALGEILIDFTTSGVSSAGQKLFEQNPGGAPANVLAALNKCGCKTAFIGKIGTDMHGTFLKETLEKNGILAQGIVEDASVFTTLAFVSLSEDGERVFSFARKPGADTCLTREEVEVELIKSSKVFHIGSLSLTDEPIRGTTFYALEIAKQSGCIISYDPNYRAPLWKSEAHAIENMRSVLPYVDIMKLSDEEIVFLTDKEEPEEAAKYLLEQGLVFVAVTLGQEGALICNKEGAIKVPGFKTQVVDATGAGDSFWGGFLSQLIESGKRLEEISLGEAAEFVRFGNAVASLCVEKRGGIPAMPEKGNVIKRLQEI